MRRFFVEHTTNVGDEVLLTGADAKHICTVLRLKQGARVVLVDGAGQEYLSRITTVSPGRVLVAIHDLRISEAESPVHITVAQGYLKEKKMDGLVRGLTELGMNRWVPFFAERSVARPPENRLAARIERWRKISKEALKQCRRGCTLEIMSARTFEAALALGDDSDLKIVFWEQAADVIPSTKENGEGNAYRRVFVLLGPEGGLSRKEIALAKDAGFKIATLGPRILRAETATLVACGLIQYLLGDLTLSNS